MSQHVVIAKIVGAHGLNGECRVETYCQTSIPPYGQVLLAQETRARAIRWRAGANGRVLARIEGIHTREQAKSRCQTRLQVPRSEIRALATEEYLCCDLIGKAVYVCHAGDHTSQTHRSELEDAAWSEFSRHVGQVAQVCNFGAGDILVVTDNDGEQTFLPFHREAIPHVSERGIAVIEHYWQSFRQNPDVAKTHART